jgi:diguanylate cyclase (GGDEF)-like protein/PAS domain S-box-containing protein
MSVVKSQYSVLPHAISFGDGMLPRDFAEVSAIPTFFLSDRDGLVYANRAFGALLGYDPAHCIGFGIGKIVHPGDVAAARARYARAMKGHRGAGQSETRFLRKNGDAVWVRASAILLPAVDGHAPYLAVQAIDITDIKTAKQELQFANTLLRTQMDASPDGILVVDENAKVISYNERFARMLNIPLDLLQAEDDAPVLAAATAAMKNPAAFLARVRYLYEHPDETSHDELETIDGRSIERHTQALRTPAGLYLGRVWFFRDITERKKTEAQILRMARSDALTGLPNRLVFMEGIERAIAAVQNDGKTFALLYIDLDRFKDVNDTLGHPAGDELLIAVAGRLQSNLRSHDLVARFGGDEFAMIVTDIDDAADAAAVAEGLIGAMHAPFRIKGYELRSSVSIGIALFGSGRPNAETLLARADIALYRAKSEGAGGYQFHTDAMDREIRTRVMLGSELREGINAGQLFLVYQPQVEIATGRITGVEALVRWRHPTRGVLGPDLFIPIAEKSGLIVDLGHWVMQTACAQAKQWLDAGIQLDALAVNLSGVQFKRAYELEKQIGMVLAATDMPARRLELELTETVLMTTSIDHSDVLNRLRQAGIRFAIDDFGVGYSSLDYLRRFPVDRIKIAGVFVAQITAEAGSAAIVKATLGLARELGIRVIAEGIETVEQLNLLRSWGCLEAQGDYFGKARAVDDVTPLLQSGRIAPG